MKKINLLFFLSLVFCAFGQPLYHPLFCFFTATMGYGLFFYAIRQICEKKRRFLYGFLFFSCLTAFQTSWMASTVYQGYLIMIVYLFLSLAMGAQFALLTQFVPVKHSLTFSRLLAAAALWTLLEWMRVYFISGFTWNPVGLSLSYSHYALGLASIGGVYFLSFYVMLTNLMVYRALLKKTYGLSVFLAGFPLVFGFVQQKVVKQDSSKELKVALIQTALAPEEKEPYFHLASYVPASSQWLRILNYLKHQKDLDLIVLPEVALPFSAYKPYYYLNAFHQVWSQVFQKKIDVQAYLKEPLASRDQEGQWRLTNAFWVQVLADYFKAEVIVGLDDFDERKKESYNAAFHFKPHQKANRYIKQILVPLGEYLPFKALKEFAKQYGLNFFFTPGKESNVFQGKQTYGISICYEETYSGIMRKSRLNGADLFINITNDGWFPNTTLPQQHFYHGLLRSVENGVGVVRVGNTGVTGYIDAFGKIKQIFSLNEKDRGMLVLTIPSYSYSTLYTKVGDGLIVGVSTLLFLIFLRRKKLARKAFVG